MLFFGAAGILAFFSLIFLLFGVALQRETIGFESNKRIGKAEVTGYSRRSGSNYRMLMVRLLNFRDADCYSCASGKINVSEYPIGTVVDVIYAPVKKLGVNVVEIHLIENPPANSSGSAHIMKMLALGLIIIAAMLVATGIVIVII